MQLTEQEWDPDVFLKSWSDWKVSEHYLKWRQLHAWLETSHYKSYITELTAKVSACFYLNHESSHQLSGCIKLTPSWQLNSVIYAILIGPLHKYHLERFHLVLSLKFTSRFMIG